jgi:hypothetical protein
VAMLVIPCPRPARPAAGAAPPADGVPEPESPASDVA